MQVAGFERKKLNLPENWNFQQVINWSLLQFEIAGFKSSSRAIRIISSFLFPLRPNS